MRTWIALALLAAVAFSGCAAEDGSIPTPAETDDTGGNETVEPDLNATVDNATNQPPVAGFTADVLNGTAPLNVTLSIDGSDADGDSLTWDLSGNGTSLAKGSQLPAEHVVAIAEPGNHTFVLSVSDGNATVQRNLTIVALAGLPSGPEVFFIHAEGSGDGTMDHVPSAGQEGGHGTVNLAGVPPYSKSYVATESTLAAHSLGTPIEAHVQAFAMVPSPQTSMTGTLYADDVAVGTASSTAKDVVTVALVTTPCTDWTIAFELTADVPAGATLRFDVEADNVVRLASCYPGGEDGPRVVLG